MGRSASLPSCCSRRRGRCWRSPRSPSARTPGRCRRRTAPRLRSASAPRWGLRRVDALRLLSFWIEPGSVLGVVIESEDHDGIELNIDSIENDERGLGDPHLVDVSVLEVLAGVGARREKLKEKAVDPGEGSFRDRTPKTTNSELKLVGDVRLDACREGDFHDRLKLKRLARRSKASL